MTHVCTSEYINGRGLRKFEDKLTWLTMICLAKDTVYIHPTWFTTLFWKRTNSYDYQSKTTCSTDNTRRVPVTLFKYTTRTVLQFWHAQILCIQEMMTKVKYIVSFVNRKIQVRIFVTRRQNQNYETIPRSTQIPWHEIMDMSCSTLMWRTTSRKCNKRNLFWRQD